MHPPDVRIVSTTGPRRDDLTVDLEQAGEIDIGIAVCSSVRRSAPTVRLGGGRLAKVAWD